MGFHKRYVPEINELKQQHASLSEDEFALLYSKPDALMGSPESFRYLDAFFAKRQKAVQEVTTGNLKKK